MNWFIILIFIIQMVSCSTAAFFYYAWENNHINELSYLEMDKIPLNHYHFMAKYFIKVGNWILIFTNFVPISLLVTLEMVKLFQAVLMT
jgi:phospholipid-transporting ATPase